MDVKISTFINLHLFWVTENSDKRLKTLDNISNRLQNVAILNDFKTDQIVAVKNGKSTVRATVDKILYDTETNENLFLCWLLDYGELIEVDKVYELPRELHEIPPQARQVCLNNICFVKNSLELGVASTIKNIPTATPTSASYNYCTELFNGATKFIFQAFDENNGILFGDFLVRKDGRDLSLSDELCNKNLTMKNDIVFEKIRNEARTFRKLYLDTIRQICRMQRAEVKKSSTAINNNCKDQKIYQDMDYDDMEVYVQKPLQNGRRRYKAWGSSTGSVTSGSSVSDSEHNHQQNSSSPVAENKAASPLERNKQSIMAGQNKDKETVNNVPEEEEVLDMKEIRKQLAARRKAVGNGTESRGSSFVPSIESGKKSQDGEGSNVTSEETNDSPKPGCSSDKPSTKRKLPLNINFMPAGSESHLKNTKKITPAVIPNSIISPSKSTNSEPENETSSVRSETDTSKTDDSSPSDRPPLVFPTSATNCQCKDCNIRYEDDEWDNSITFMDSEHRKQLEERPIIRPPLLLRPADEEAVQDNEILSVVFSTMTQMQRQTVGKLLVHGESIVSPAQRISQLFLHNEIHKSMANRGYQETKRIQKYACPAITRNQHVFMIGNRQSGKTMAYLPVVCSFVLEKERYSQLPRMEGSPVVLILCSRSSKCEEIYDLTKVLVNKGVKISLMTYPEHRKLHDVDILVTMPSVLNGLLLTRAVNFKRLCHLVLDDADVVLKSHQPLVNEFLSLTDKMLAHRTCPKSVQLIVCSEHWTSQIEKLLKQINRPPLVCITNYLEAALYGKIIYTIKFLNSACKEQEIKNLLLSDHKIIKSLIICDPDEVDEVYTILMLKGIDATPIRDNMETEEIMYLDEVWNSTKAGSFTVLICSDYIYNTVLAVTNVSLLIHYTLPDTWSQYVRRFSCLLDNCPSPLDVKGKKLPIRSVVLIDEKCEPRMSKFGTFIRSSLLWDQLDETFQSYLNDVRLKDERKKIEKRIELCERLKVFGECADCECKYRHLADKVVDADEYLPKNGSIKFKIMEMSDVTTCTVKIIERFDNNGNSVGTEDDRSEEIANLLSQCPLNKYVTTAIEGHTYLYSCNDYSARCRLLKVDKNVVHIVLIDKGIKMKTDLSQLFRLSPELKNIPPQTYEVYFTNLIPSHDDLEFSAKAYKSLVQIIEEYRCYTMVFRADIHLQLGRNLWLNDVIEERELFDKSLPTMGLQLSRELVRQGLAAQSEKPLFKLYELCKQAQISLPDYKIKKRKIVKVTPQPKPQWAFLDTERVNEVIFSSAVSPDEFYVKLAKFNKFLVQLERDIQQEIKKPFYPKVDKIDVGKCYLAKDANTGNYSRVLVRNINEHHALCFSVDYGDETLVELSELKHLSDMLLLKLPFQAIQCKMFGVRQIDEEWDSAATDLLYEFGFEPGTDIFRSIYVKTRSEMANSVVPEQKCYSVILKDGFNKRHILLNNLLIDCGYAALTDESIEDFIISDTSSGDSESCDEDSLSDFEYEAEEEPVDLENDDFDFFIEDLEQFCIDNLIYSNTNRSNDTNVERNTDKLPAIKCAPKVDYFTPDCIWSQTDSVVKLTIAIPDVNVYTVGVSQERVFNFCTHKDGKKYLLKLLLFESVKKTFQHSASGPVVKVTLTKIKENFEWPRLVYSKEKFRNIRFDVNTLNVAEEKKKKMLELPISDHESDGEDNDMVFYCSDRDSEYDEDLPDLI